MADGDLDRELKICGDALAVRDLPHALRHLGDALAIAPLDERAHALLESAAQLGDIAEHLKPDFLGSALLLAFAHRRAGRIDDAATILANCCTVGRGLETLLASWLVALDARHGKLAAAAANHVEGVLGFACRSTIGLNRLLAGERALLVGYGDLAAALVSVDPRSTGTIMASGALRRVQRYEEALAIALPPDGEPRRLALTQRGLCLRAMGKPDEAREMFAAALALAPGDFDLTSELARCHFVAGDFASALKLLEQIDPPLHPELVSLARLCRDQPDIDRLEALDRNRRIFVQSKLQTPYDATAKMIWQLLAKSKAVAGTRVSVSGWEPPSDRLLLALVAASTTDVTAAKYDGQPGALDFKPMNLRRGARLAVWVERDGIPVQFTGPPLDELRSAIGKLSIPDDSLIDLWDRAAELGKRLSPLLAIDIVAAMVHPPTNQEWLAALPSALYRHQVAGACVLANLPAPWSEIRPIFESLLFGPIDWVSGAAVLALGELAKRDPAKAYEIRNLLCAVPIDLATHDCEPRRRPLLYVFATLPAVSHAAQKELQAKVPPTPDPTARSAEEQDEEEEDETDSMPDGRVGPIGPPAPSTQSSPVARWIWWIWLLFVAGSLFRLLLG